MELFKIGFITIRLIDLIDIAVVAWLLYKLYALLRGSLALRVVGVIFSVFVIWKLVDLLDMYLLKGILDQFIGIGAIALVILFAGEIRRFLLQIGKNTFFDRIWRQLSGDSASSTKVEDIVDAALALQKSGTGALIVLAGRDDLEAIRQTGDQIEAEVSSRLLQAIFAKDSPLHDGAVVIHEDRIAAARCVLPLSESDQLPPELGLRHKAALGMSEVSESLIIVISEERKEISIARQGKLSRRIKEEEMLNSLNAFFGEKQ